MNWLEMCDCSLGDWHQVVAGPFSLKWPQGSSLVVSGPNGSGKSALAALWTGHLDAVKGTFQTHKDFRRVEEAWIGFERQRLLLEWERHIDTSDISESPDPGTLTKDFVGDSELLARFGLAEKGDRGLKHLSTGELRRACLARAWFLNLPFLILDEPFEGLDVAGGALLSALVLEARHSGRDVVFLTRRPDDVPGDDWTMLTLPAPREIQTESSPVLFERDPHGQGECVLDFQDIVVGYPGVPVFDHWTWQVRKGDRWLVRGPNGSGKSTLMALIAGDHPQVFANEIRLFGRRRGPELTLAEVKRRIVLVSYAAHLSFRNLFGVTGLEVMVSGFSGTIGLWEEPRWDQIETCRRLAEEWGLGEASQRPWEDLSWGTQRLLLLARALVAGADILLLDEPCQGLDTVARAQFLRRVSLWCEDPEHTLIYVTHRADEVPVDAFQVRELRPIQRG